MRIGYISTYPPIECGIGTYTQALNEALRRLKHETFVVSQAGAAGPDVFPVYRPEQPTFVDDVFYTAASMTPDLVHVQHEFGMYGPLKGARIADVLLRFRLVGVPRVTTLHTVNEDPDELERVLVERLLGESNAVVVHEQFQKAALEGVFGASDKIRVIEHGIREVAPVPEAKKKLGLEGKKVVMLCGYLRPTKGFHRALAFFPEISRRVPDAVLVLAGKARTSLALDYQRRLFRQFRESPAADRIVFFRGQFPQHTFDTLLSAADCVLLPYERGAQSGLMCQCFAHGCPVVTSDLRAFRLLAERSGGGLTCRTDEEFVDAVVRVLGDQELRRRMQADIRRYVQERAGWRHIARRHAELYWEIIEPYGEGQYVYVPED